MDGLRELKTITGDSCVCEVCLAFEKVCKGGDSLVGSGDGTSFSVVIWCK